MNPSRFPAGREKSGASSACSAGWPPSATFCVRLVLTSSLEIGENLSHDAPLRLPRVRRRQPPLRDRGRVHPSPARSATSARSSTSRSGAAPRSRSAARSASTSRTRPSTSWPARVRRRSTSASATRRASRTASSIGEPMKCIPAFREPGPRLELMDEQGVDRTLMFPTLASLLEERMRDDPGADPRRDPLAERVAVRDVVVQLRGPHLRDAGHHAADRREGDRGAGVVRRARRQDGAHPPRAGAGLRRLALVRLPEFDPFWQARRRRRHPRVDARVGQRLLPLPERLDRPDGDAAVPARPVPLDDDGQAPDRGRDGGVRLPRRVHAVPRPAGRRRSRTAATGSSPFLDHLEDVHRKMPRPSTRIRSRRSSATSTSARSTRTTRARSSRRSASTTCSSARTTRTPRVSPSRAATSTTCRPACPDERRRQRSWAATWRSIMRVPV